MQPEQQQRIMGYFIEEAKDHLNTIEQGLLNLQGTIDDPEMVNEVFRAAHSVKGGAAMLGLSSIQKTSHRLEDFFKILKETPGIRPDQKLESLLLQVFDTLQELVEQLQGPFGLTEEAANATMAGVEPVFAELKQHMAVLEGQSGTAITANLTDEPAPVSQPVNASQDSALLLIFQNDVPAQLREMLQLFRQAETLSDGRDRLQEVCRSLKGLGEAFDLTQWCELVEMASRAIADSDNSYRALAPIVIKDLKQGQETILAGRVADIVPSEQLRALAPMEVLPDLAVDGDLSDFFAISDDSATEPLDSEFDSTTTAPGFDSLELGDLELSDLDFETALFEAENRRTPENERVEAIDLKETSAEADLKETSAEADLKETSAEADLKETSAEANRNGPEVGMAELNSLADLFEGEMPDLGSTWQEEEVINHASSSASSLDGMFDAEDTNDFSELLFEEADSPISASSTEDLNNLFADDLLGTSSSAVGSEADDFGLPDFDANLSEPPEASTPGLTVSSLDPFADLNLEELGDVDSEPADDLFDRNPQESNASLDDLGELFAGLDETDLSFTPLQTASTDTLGSAESPFGEVNFDAGLENVAAPESVADAWGDLDLSEPLFSMPESGQAQNGGDLTQASLFDLTDLSDSTSNPLDELTARSSESVSPQLEELGDPWGELEASANSSSGLEADLNFDLSDLNSSENSLELPDDLFAEDSTGEETIQIDAEDLFGSETSSEEDDQRFDALFNNELDPPELGETGGFGETEGTSTIESSLTSTSLEESSGLLDDPFNFASSDQTNLNDRLGTNSDDLEPGSLENDFLNLGAEENLDSLLADSTPIAVEPTSNVNSDPGEMAGLFEAEDSLNFDLNETDDELDDLFGEPSETPDLFSEDTALSLELEELNISASESDRAIEAIVPSANPGDLDFDFGDDETSADLDSLLNFDEDDPLNDNFLSSDATDGLDELLSLDPTQTSEFDASSEDLTLELADSPTSEPALNLEEELFDFSTTEVSTSEENPSLSLDDAFLNSDTTDGLDELLNLDLMQTSEFDASSEDLTLELADSPTSEPALNLEEELFDFSTTEEDLSDTLNGSAPQASEETASDESLDFFLNDPLDLEEHSLSNENAQPGTDDLLSMLDFDEIGESESATAPSESDFDLSFADLDAPTLDASESLLDDLDLDFGEAENLIQTAADSEPVFDLGLADSPSDDDELLDELDFDLPEMTRSDAASDFDLAFPDLEAVGEDDSSDNPSDSSERSGLDPLLSAGVAAASLGVGMFAASRADDLFELPARDRSDVENTAETEDDDLDFLLDTESPELADNTSELDGLEDLLDIDSTSTFTGADEFSDLDVLFGEDLTETSAASQSGSLLQKPDQAAADEFDDLDALLAEETNDFQPARVGENFDDLESLLADAPEAAQSAFSSEDTDTEFDDLEKMLEDADKTMGGTPSVKSLGITQPGRRTNRPGKVFSEQTMRVPIKHLDNLSNLVGELVVNRNSLEQDQERLRQSLDNLLYQVQQLSDVGQRMQDLYERSLLESSLLASRQHHRTPTNLGSLARDNSSPSSSSNSMEYDPLEMDRFTGFHSLSQEMIELIVRVRESASDIGFIVDETDQVTRMFRQVTTQLQEGLTRSRMVPFAQTADRMPRAVRDIAMKCGKQAELVIEGRDTLIDKMILEHLYDPMTHLVNNALTHGIETPDVRRATGKSPTGRITIRAFHQGNQTVISVSDDGAGVDVDLVKTKAIEKGLITPAEARTMTRLDIYDLLFHPGFTTKDQADDFSGRGVGMDVVRTSLSEIRGAITTDSASAKGTTFTIRLPLTLSISKALCCISDRARIAFPMDGVEDMFDIPKERIQTNADGQACLSWRESLLPLRPLTELLGYNRHLSRGNVYGGNQEDDMVSVVVLRSAGNFLALQVDQVLGEQEIVIKQLEGPVPKPVGVAGATVLGDGRIMPIADVLELIDLSMGRIRRDVGTMWDQGTTHPNEALTVKTEPTVLIVDDSITVRELLSMTFNKVGYRVEQARDGQEAWEKLRAGLPCDIVFCDIEMPRMDGLELLSRIQKDPNLSHLPIAMLTSRGADRHRQMAVSLGASGYFTKPYLEEALLDAAQRMLKGEVLIAGSGS
ncbi:response regulator [Phormidesmis priestleyi]